MRYGLPYQGSKNKLAERIVNLLPEAEHFYDVFAGGCAVSHAALLSGKFGKVHFSDINDSVVLFRDCLEGNIPDGSEWISREDFFIRKDTDPYVRLVWSFGNNQKNYLYSQDIEPYKRAVHEMIFAPTPNERRLKFREVCKLIPSVLGLNGGVRRISDHESTERLQRLHTDFNISNLNYPPPANTYQSEYCKTINRAKHISDFKQYRTQPIAKRGAEEGYPKTPLFWWGV